MPYRQAVYLTKFYHEAVLVGSLIADEETKYIPQDWWNGSRFMESCII
jgi:hypothetical protein